MDAADPSLPGDDHRFADMFVMPAMRSVMRGLGCVTIAFRRIGSPSTVFWLMASTHASGVEGRFAVTLYERWC